MSVRRQAKNFVRQIGESCIRLSDLLDFHAFIQPNKQATKPSIIQNIYFGYVNYETALEIGDVFTDAADQHWIVQIVNPWYLHGDLSGHHLTLLRVNATVYTMTWDVLPPVMGGIPPSTTYTVGTTAYYANILEKGEALLHRPEDEVASYDFIIYVPDTIGVTEQQMLRISQYKNHGMNQIPVKVETINVIDMPGLLVLECTRMKAN